jgi:tetratricopeptide (TPR) repeat protein
MSFSLIPGSPFAGSKQYEAHINKLIYLKNLRRVTDDVGNYMLANIAERLDDSMLQAQENYERNAEEKRQFALAVNGTLEQGFNQLSENLSDRFSELSDVISEVGENLDVMNDNIQAMGRCLVELNNLLDWKTDRIIECQIRTNTYLSELIVVTMKSDDEKRKIEHINRSGNYLTSAIKDGPDSEYFRLSMDFLQKIDEIDPHDFISHFRKGIIYSQSASFLNLDKAIECFNNSILYGKSILTSNLNSSVKELSEEIIRTSHYYLSICAYAKENFFESLIQAEQAYKLMPNNPAFCIRTAKMLSVNGRESEAINYIHQAITIEPNYINEVINDDDLITKQIIKDYINQKILPLIDEVQNRLIEASKYIIPETKELEELNTLIHSFQNTYVNARNCLSILEATDLEKRIESVNISFFKACEQFQEDQKKLIELTSDDYDKSPWKYEKNFKTEVKKLGYMPASFRFYIEQDYFSNNRKTYHTHNEDKLENTTRLGSPLRPTVPLVNKLETFDYRWFEWVYESDIEKNKLTPICRIAKQGNSILVMKRDLNHYSFYINDSFGFSITLITSDGFFVEIGFIVYITVYDPLAMFKKYSDGHFPIKIAEMLAQKVRNSIGKISYKEVWELHELRQSIQEDFNQNAKNNKEGFTLTSFFFHERQRYTFKNYKLEPA